MIRFRCPECDAQLSAGDEKIGAEARCPACHHKFRCASPPAGSPKAGRAALWTWRVVVTALALAGWSTRPTEEARNEIMTGGVTASKSDVGSFVCLNARRLEVSAPEGRAKMVILGLENGIAMMVHDGTEALRWNMLVTPEEYRMTARSADGTMRHTQRLDANGLAEHWYDADGTGRMQLKLEDNGPSLAMWDGEHRKRIAISALTHPATAGVVVLDRNERPRRSLTTD